MGALSSRFGSRFLVVTVLPNILLIGYVGILLAAGAPTHSPSLSRALAALDHLTVYRVAAIILGVIIISAASHPLQIPLIQLLEGYWWGLPFGRKMADRATRRFRDELTRVTSELDDMADPAELDWAARNSANRAQLRRDWLPGYEEDLRPTVLGNTLWKGETTAGGRYGLDLNVALPRIIPLMSPSVLAELSDRRNQLDAAVRISVAAGVATMITIGMLLRDGPWLFLALATYLLCWASYQAAIAAARGFSIILAAAVDLYHLQLFDALSLKRPAGIEEEIARNTVLTDFLRGYNLYHLSEASKGVMRYAAAETDNKGDTGQSAATTSPGSAGDSAGP
jgi:hypothetical protein